MYKMVVMILYNRINVLILIVFICVIFIIRIKGFLILFL